MELQETSRQIIRFEKPTIAAINGYALGSGYELALACDIRIAADEAQIGSPEAKVTSSVTGGAMRLVQDLIGPGKARELLFTADTIDGREAARRPAARRRFGNCCCCVRRWSNLIQRSPKWT